MSATIQIYLNDEEENTLRKKLKKDESMTQAAKRLLLV